MLKLTLRVPVGVGDGGLRALSVEVDHGPNLRGQAAAGDPLWRAVHVEHQLPLCRHGSGQVRGGSEGPGISGTHPYFINYVVRTNDVN